MDHEELSVERARIDSIDDEILKLLQERVGCALRVGEKKSELGLPLFDPARESRIYDRLRSRNAALRLGETSTLPDSAIVAIFREIISACRNAEHPTRVAFLGPAGTNTQEAAVRYFGSAFTPLPCGTPDEVCNATARGALAGGADYGVLAIENSTHGIVSPTLDLLAAAPITVCAEIKHNIHACLLSNTELGRITTVYSHEQALAQCRNWLASHLPGAALVPVTSTARGAEMARHEAGTAAIGAAIAANIYGLQIVASNIEDLASNTTRFFVISKETSTPAPSGHDKTSLTFMVPHRPGALVEVLGVFTKHGVNLSMIQSRPTRQETWEYRFFADVQAHREDESLKAALDELENHTVSYKILGSYPEAE